MKGIKEICKKKRGEYGTFRNWEYIWAKSVDKKTNVFCLKPGYCQKTRRLLILQIQFEDNINSTKASGPCVDDPWEVIEASHGCITLAQGTCWSNLNSLVSGKWLFNIFLTWFKGRHERIRRPSYYKLNRNTTGWIVNSSYSSRTQKRMELLKQILWQ